MGKKIGLVLGSGGVRGLSHIPIIELIESLKIPIFAISGSSIGSIIGASYLLGTLPALKEEALKMPKTKIIELIDPLFSKSGMIKGNKILKYLQKFIPESKNFEDLKIRFSIIATDYNTGNQVVFSKGNILKAIRASISIPAIFMPVSYRDTILIDGGIANPLPIDQVRIMGAEKIIAINLYPSVKKKGNVSSLNKNRDSSSEIQVNIPNHYLKKNTGPSIIDVLSQTIRMFEYSNTVKIMNRETPDLVIEPDVLNLPFIDFTQMRKAYEKGIVAARLSKRQLKELI